MITLARVDNQLVTEVGVGACLKSPGQKLKRSGSIYLSHIIKKNHDEKGNATKSKLL